jgi:ankyrin repeat protein
MPTRPLPNNPSLEHLRKDAKRLRAAVLSGDDAAVVRVKEFHPRADRAIRRFSLADAQLATARSYGFASWTKLKQHLAEIEPFVWNGPPPPNPDSHADVFIRLACLTYTDTHPSPVRARRMLTDHSEIARASIYTAAAAGDVATLRVMLDRNPDLLNRKGGPLHWEPLLYACYSRLEATGPTDSTLEVARLLLSRGADPDAGFLYSGSYAFTALTGAFGRGEDWPNQPPHPECDALARLLLDAGADPNDAQTLYNRHFKNNDDHLKLLFDYGLGREKGGPWIRRLNDPYFTPVSPLVIELCAAAQHNFFDRVKLLVHNGVDVNARSRRTGRTPYEEALRAGTHEIAEYLIHHGAKKVELDPLETFALACIGGRRDEVRGRLAADPTLLDRLGHQGRMDMLHRAVEGKQVGGIRLIVGLGVDINGMVPGTGMDRAVLHNAAGWGELDVVKLLIELGADPNLRDLTYHAMPIGWALYNRNQPEVIDYLLQYATIFDAVRSGAVERVDALLRQDPSLARGHDDKGTPLVFFLHPEMARLDEMLRLVVAHGVDLDARDKAGQTLLDRALAYRFTEFADILRAHGATGPR